MSLKHGLLGLLSYGQMTGYELDKTFKDSLYYFWPAQTSQIYRELNEMERLEWLTSEIIIQTDKPNRKLYHITASGEAELQNWLSENSLEKEFQVRSLFLLKLFFSGERTPKENLDTLKEYRAKCLDELKALEQVGGKIEHYADNTRNPHDSVYWKLTAQFGKLHTQMCLDFADEAIRTLAGLL